MRSLVLFTLVLVFVACSDLKKDVKENFVVGNHMDKKAKAAFDGLKTTYESLASSMKPRGESALMDIPPFIVIRDMDSLDVEVMPYYDFDEEKFYEDPSPENILKNLSKAEDKVYFTVKKNGEIMYSIMAVQKKGKWQLEGMSEDWGKVIGWLPAKLAEAGTNSYKIFRPCGLEYVVYDRNGKPVFCRITGEEEDSAEKMCESFVNMINQGKENMKFLEENAKNLLEQYEAEK